ncbi:MAG: sulfite exporter TauE/SafE family protein [Nitrospinota bacterium]
MELYFSYVAIGVISGTFAGLLGLGGGLVVVPALTFLFFSRGYGSEHAIHIAAGTSLATIMVTSLSSTYAHNKRGGVLWGVAKKIFPGILLGALIGVFLANSIPENLLQVFFGLFEIFVACKVFLKTPTQKFSSPPSAGWKFFWGGSLIGTVSSMLGVGGGTFIVPFLLWFRVSIRKAIGTAAACGFPLASAGCVGFIISGWNVKGLPASCVGYVDVTSFIFISFATLFSVPFGARMAYVLPVKALRIIFSGVLFFLGLGMLLL